MKRSEAEAHSRGDIREVRTSDGTPFVRAKTGGARTAIPYANGDALIIPYAANKGSPSRVNQFGLPYPPNAFAHIGAASPPPVAPPSIGTSA